MNLQLDCVFFQIGSFDLEFISLVRESFILAEIGNASREGVDPVKTGRQNKA